MDNIFVERLWRKVKYEDVCLNGYATMGDLHEGTTRYFAFDNGERLHQALNYLTPDRVYASGEGVGAMIVDKYGSVSAPEEDASRAGEHGALPQTPPCRERTATIPAFIGG